MIPKEKNEFRLWVDEQPRAMRAILAYRSLLRVAPYLLEGTFGSEQNAYHALVSLRLVLSVGVFARSESSQVLATLSEAAIRARKQLVYTDEGYSSQAAHQAAAGLVGPKVDPIRAIDFPMYRILGVAEYAEAEEQERVACRDALLSAAVKDALDLQSGNDLIQKSVDAIELVSRLCPPFAQAGAFDDKPEWDFWRQWYDRAMAGDPLPWDLQREIVLIPDEIWEAGPEAVAERIEVIRKKHDMLKRIAELERSLELHMSGNRHGIGGNKPPEPIDDGTFDDTATAIRERIVVVWDATEILTDEADKEVPDKSRVGQAIEMIAGAVAALAKFSAQVVAYVAHTVFQASVAAGCAVLAADPVLLEKLLIAARSWLAVLH